MPVKIVADENIDFSIIDSLRNSNIPVISIFESFRGVKDKEVIDLAVRTRSLLLTEDKDFGEWIFAHGATTVGVIFLRYEQSEKEEIILNLPKLLTEFNEKLYNKFTVMSKNKIPIRDI